MTAYEFRLNLKTNYPDTYRLIYLVTMPVFRMYRKLKSFLFLRRTVKNVDFLGHRFKIVLDPSNGLVDEAIFIGGVYEPKILEIIHKYLQKDGIFVDIGSNIGQHALFASSILGENGLVVCFEPIHKLTEQIEESVGVNDFKNRVRVINKACGQKEGNALVHLKRGNIGGSSIISGDCRDVENITVCIADEELKSLSRKIDLVKIDVEGFELEVVKGMNNTIRSSLPVVILEFSPIFWVDNTKDMSLELLGYFSDLGYKIYDIENNNHEIKDIHFWLSNFDKDQTNLLFVPNTIPR